MNLGISDGKIAYVGTKDLAITAGETIDARGNYVLPGIIDAHCHFGVPGQSFEDCVLKETQAAAFGGVTTAFHLHALHHRCLMFHANCSTRERGFTTIFPCSEPQ